MPSHPNVRKPIDTVVVSTDIANHQEGFVCCMLYPAIKNGSLDVKVVESERAGTRLAHKKMQGGIAERLQQSTPLTL
jgi:hypothetical protein